MGAGHPGQNYKGILISRPLFVLLMDTNSSDFGVPLCFTINLIEVNTPHKGANKRKKNSEYTLINFQYNSNFDSVSEVSHKCTMICC